MSDTPTLHALVHPNSISAGPIPEQQSFTFLKQQGIKHLKRLAGQVWTNYNDSDPGVTILDQVVYALTELGYVNSFSIEDVLTQPDGSIRYQEQFFNPEAILTTGPVTADDYRRLVVDRIAHVDNLYISPQQITVDDELINTGFYHVDIYSRKLLGHAEPPHATSSLAEQRASLAREVHRELNSQRNVGEFFLLPTVLQAQEIALLGNVVLAADADVTQVYKEIDLALAQYVSPLIEQVGFQQAQSQGATADEIFNGPELTQGWIIRDAGLGEPRRYVTLVDIITTLSAVEGVIALDNVAFTPASIDVSSKKDAINIHRGCAAHITLDPAFTVVKSQAQHNKTAWQQTVSELHQLKSQLAASSIDAKVDIAPPLPEGRFRHIENYYSIQYTFPDIYGVGPNSLQSDAPDYRVAQARQLKGYLVLFDQVIANQLSQLANLNNLFSFSFSRIPSSEAEYHASVKLQAEQQRATVTPSIPMQPFARSYFCQPLYDVPDVQALLSGQNSYQYFYPDDPKDSTQRAQLVWKRFKADPFNQYFYGLNHAQESVEDAEQRRDQMLSHLLARQGESADLYNDMIDATQWYGGIHKTRIMVKTLWLQNLQGLSYRRNQAIDFADCQPLQPLGRYYLSDNDYQQLLIERGTDILPFLNAIRGQGFSHYNDVVRTLARSRVAQLQQHIADSGKTSKVNAAKVLQRSQAVAKALPLQDNNQTLLNKQPPLLGNGLMLDGTYNASTLDNNAKLSQDDYRSHATFVLKINLLLGLTQHYSALALALVRLLEANGFNAWLTAHASSSNDATFPTATVSSDDPLHDTHAEFTTLPPQPPTTAAPAQRVLRICISDTPVLHIPAATLTHTQLQQYADQLLWLAKHQGSVLVEHTLLQHSIADGSATTDDWFCLQASLIFPSYVLQTQQAQFSYFLSVLQQLHWPSHIALQYCQADLTQMSTLISAYNTWYVAMSEFSGNTRPTANANRQALNTTPDSDASTDYTSLFTAQTQLKSAIDGLEPLDQPPVVHAKTTVNHSNQPDAQTLSANEESTHGDQ